MKNPPNEIEVTLAITINGVTATQTLAGLVPVLSKGHATFKVDKANEHPENRLLFKLIMNVLATYGKARFGDDQESYEAWLLSQHNLTPENFKSLMSLEPK